MEIFINNSKIDFQLENETILHQVVEGLFNWAETSNFQIENILFDEKHYDLESSVCRETPVNSVKLLQVSGRNIIEIHQDNLQLLYQYVSLLLKSIEGKNNKLIEDLKNEAPPVFKLLAKFLEESFDSEDSISRKLLLKISVLSPELNENDEAEITYLIGQLTGLKIILSERVSELTNPLGELGKTTAALKISKIEIDDISVLLQTGKDRDALNSIIKFSELNQKTLRLYPILKSRGILDFENIIIDDKALSEYYIDLNSILSELIEAFTANDSVLIGDLLEYEVAPRLDSLITVLDNIQKEQSQ